ncbi:tyrosine-type recombinase/integrase [Bacillus sp. ISL-46]|uniref:tyrosine-type recombinase/integrase n=1 Tax=Bacillus sp. ISL-46 TaxID=2819129 RepID=UPI001BE5AB73|nr:tyrosine-type recombinase/integrase [Bacillus sp. ISL-46]MBT2722660.1 tyrosine-type recombinase/integrase [Bacillus sp. ISL-46]
MLLSKAWESYEADKRIEGFSSQTLKAYHLQAKLLIRYFNDLNIGDITTIQLKEYFARSNENLKPSSLAHRIRFMKSFFRWLHEEGHILKNPAAKIKEPKVGKSILKFLTERELEHLREACNTAMEKAIFEFMFSTGCRIGEVVSLDKNCINWSNRSAIVRGKGDIEREIYFNIRCEIGLKRYLDNRQDKDPAIFVTEPIHEIFLDHEKAMLVEASHPLAIHEAQLQHIICKKISFLNGSKNEYPFNIA